MAETKQSQAHSSPSANGLSESIIERICRLACVAALMVMLVVIGVDILTRSLFNFSFEISDELGGYLLVVIAFVSLPVCQISGSFHRVELVQSRLPPFGRAVSHVIFDLLSLAFCGLLLWQLARFEISSFRFGDRAPTYLETPLWIPQAVMTLGAAALCFCMVRTLAADIARLRALAHVPTKWTPVRRLGHAPINESRAYPDSAGKGRALGKTAERAGEP